MNLFTRIESALLTTDPVEKCELVWSIHGQWQEGLLTPGVSVRLLDMENPGCPQQPVLVDPRRLGRRSTASDEGRARLLHAFAHIEFNAINIALDAVYRFRGMPLQFVGDWLLVASDEARHFSLLARELHSRGSHYGAFEAHRGLWDMVCKTRDDVLHRMALVPRVMEARGLDVTPGMIEKFGQVDDSAAVEILGIIYRDEIEHVRIGNHWYQFICEQRGLNPEQTFSQLVARYLQSKLRGPFNWPARLEAGFKASELESLERVSD